jgi:t-SNARE complex subunit (syntaxin)
LGLKLKSEQIKKRLAYYTLSQTKLQRNSKDDRKGEESGN